MWRQSSRKARSPPSWYKRRRLLKTMRTIKHKNIPSRGAQVLIQVQLIYSLPFAATMKNIKKIRYPFLNTVCPQGIPRKYDDDDEKKDTLPIFKCALLRIPRNQCLMFNFAWKVFLNYDWVPEREAVVGMQSPVSVVIQSSSVKSEITEICGIYNKRRVAIKFRVFRKWKDNAN